MDVDHADKTTAKGSSGVVDFISYFSLIGDHKENN